MPNELRFLARQLLGVTLLGCMPAVLAAFICLPYAIGHHPGDQPTSSSRVEPWHMT